ncbi:MAG: hypothetical protein CL678_19020 [Bdellovibrionaceae bacterium]|nr:hypothetical protein [Pseudobdellovibrionaceae bacterium]|tara:strand:+ start:8378 stop:9703 length:1326 start_codon:yes stop_codon:yes gene_type:complete
MNRWGKVTFIFLGSFLILSSSSFGADCDELFSLKPDLHPEDVDLPTAVAVVGKKIRDERRVQEFEKRILERDLGRSRTPQEAVESLDDQKEDLFQALGIRISSKENSLFVDLHPAFVQFLYKWLNEVVGYSTYEQALGFVDSTGMDSNHLLPIYLQLSEIIEGDSVRKAIQIDHEAIRKGRTTYADELVRVSREKGLSLSSHPRFEEFWRPEEFKGKPDTLKTYQMLLVFNYIRPLMPILLDSEQLARKFSNLGKMDEAYRQNHYDTIEVVPHGGGTHVSRQLLRVNRDLIARGEYWVNFLSKEKGSNDTQSFVEHFLLWLSRTKVVTLDDMKYITFLPFPSDWKTDYADDYLWTILVKAPAGFGSVKTKPLRMWTLFFAMAHRFYSKQFEIDYPQLDDLFGPQMQAKQGVDEPEMREFYKLVRNRLSHLGLMVTRRDSSE